MNIVLASDEKFAPHMAVTITSILVNSDKEDDFNFFIFNNDFSKQTKENFLKLRNIKDCKINFIDLSENDFSNLPTMLHYKKQIYYRLKIPEYIKEDRALYLDSDIIVRKSLKDFYNIDLKNNTMAVVEDIFGDRYKEKFKLDKYFNSGVLLLDINKARENNFCEKCIEFITENRNESICYDQDALNVVLKDNVLFCDLKYNFQYNKSYKDIAELYKKYEKDICIIHFVTGDKPWNFGSPGNFISEYYRYIYKTPWSWYSFFRKIKLIKEILSHYIL